MPTSYADRADSYARDVVDGKIPAAKWTRLACKRAIEDAGRKWDYYFDAAAANKVCKFIERCRHIKGEWARRRERIKLEPWQCFIICQVFGWKRKSDGLRRFRTAYIEVPRKNAKSTLTSAVGLYMLAADGEAGAECYSAAKGKKQAQIVFEDAQQMARSDPEFLAMLGVKVGAHSIYIPSKACKFEAVASEADSLEGRNPHFAGIDELHTHPTRKVWDVMEQAMGSRSQPLQWAITTAGGNKYGICYEIHGYLKEILEKLNQDETFFGLIYTIDEDDDPQDPESHRKANPNYGVSVKKDDLERLCAKAFRSGPAAKANYLTKRLNVWMDEASGLFDPSEWAKCGDAPEMEEFAGADCYIAVDLASREDFADVSYVFSKEIDGVEHVYAYCDHYLPEAKIQNSDNLSIAAWHEQGWITATEGETTDFDKILDDIIENLSHYQVRLIAVDPWQSVYFMQRLEKSGAKDRVLQFRQRISMMSEPTKDLMAKHRERRIHHDGDPVLAWMIANVVGKFDSGGNVMMEKSLPEKKIDGAVALAMARGAQMRDAEPEDSIYEERGILTV